MKTKIVTISLFLACALAGFSQHQIPEIYSGMGYTPDGQLYATFKGDTLLSFDRKLEYHLKEMKGDPQGTNAGIAFDFKNPDFKGLMYYGFIHYNDSRHPLPVYRSSARIENGLVEINIKNDMSGKYDMIGWEETGMGTLGYRILNSYGQMIYDGIISFKGTGPFEMASTIVEGPFINKLGPASVTVSFTTNIAVKAGINVNGNVFTDESPTTQHVIEVTGLDPDTEYDYLIDYESISQSYSFRTAPLPGTRKPFTFSYASDSRSGHGGGERDLFGANYYIMKKIMAVSMKYNSRFMQFTGDMINGYLTDKDAMELQYANWKRSIEPFARYFPVYVGMGNHESLVYRFIKPRTRMVIQIDRFPFESESSEYLFQQQFVMPENGPESEDGATYDPNPGKTDFPSYKESVFYYSYDNALKLL